MLQVAVEAFGGGMDIETSLEGTWRLLYTTASDVVREIARAQSEPKAQES